ncbi:MAG: hypothetical protein NTX64_14025, partial [Elusimicrobia bacterium]|nr:hypothetical protein [Elusimicrobiota bacterium]
ELQSVEQGIEADVIAPMMADVGETLQTYSPRLKEARRQMEALRERNDADIAYFAKYPAVEKDLKLMRSLVSAEGVAEESDVGLLTLLREMDRGLDHAIPCLRGLRKEFKPRGHGAAAGTMGEKELDCAREAEAAMRMRAQPDHGMLKYLEETRHNLELSFNSMQAALGSDPAAVARLNESLDRYRFLIIAAQNWLNPSLLTQDRKDHAVNDLSPNAAKRMKALRKLRPMTPVIGGEEEKGRQVNYLVNNAVTSLANASRAFSMRGYWGMKDSGEQFGTGMLRALETLYGLQQSLALLESIKLPENKADGTGAAPPPPETAPPARQAAPK